MMTVPQIITFLASQIENLRDGTTKRPHLCYWKGKVRIQDPHHTMQYHPITYRLTAQQMQAGLTSDEWEELAIAALLLAMTKNGQIDTSTEESKQ